MPYIGLVCKAMLTQIRCIVKCPLQRAFSDQRRFIKPAIDLLNIQPLRHKLNILCSFINSLTTHEIAN